jgi:hypothetical protein
MTQKGQEDKGNYTERTKAREMTQKGQEGRRNDTEV